MGGLGCGFSSEALSGGSMERSSAGPEEVGRWKEVTGWPWL